jgi:FMN-dependent NADH-azoreductase
MKEEITKARHSSSFLLSDLKEAYRRASPKEEIVVRQLLQQAVDLERRLKEFADAINAERN